jgi:AcrR family transcriptional regulator
MEKLVQVPTSDARDDSRRTILDAAEKLFRQIGFHKTTIADIAQGLRMSSANVYRFFGSKAEINEAVARRLLAEMETAVAGIARGAGSASQKLRACIGAVDDANARRFLSNSKFHELIETAFNENWLIVREYIEAIDKSLSEIISEGQRVGEFHVLDCDLAAILVRSACTRFCHPRLAVECAEEAEPTIDEMVDFCLVALRGLRTGEVKEPGAG